MRALRILLAATIAATVVAAPSVSHAQSAPTQPDTIKVDVTGKWAFAIEQPFSGTPTVHFVQKGDSISGRYVSNALGTREFVGTVKAGKIAFSFTAESGGQNFVMAFAGKIEDKDTMSGTIDFSGMATGTFSARRVKE
ncbi:MAG TPA: hypothetical protein VFO55_11345 [Gemmatimonadaceae bacterium]|nr:hypothetical protein [Gemmatimonadaceae bacterium]